MTRHVTLLFLCATLIGCGRIPEPATYDYSQQRKMQASHHWDVLAADVANEINKALIMSDYLNTPVHVRETCGDDNTPCAKRTTSLFNETFRDLLVTHLVNLGIPTHAGPGEQSIEIQYKAQQVYHHKKRWRTVRPGMLTALTAGVIVFRNAPWEMAAIAAAGAADAANAAYTGGSHFEVVITTSMTVRDKYLFRNTSIYYINDADSWHYNTPAEASDIALTATDAHPGGAAREEGRQTIPMIPDDDPAPLIPPPESSEPPTGI